MKLLVVSAAVFGTSVYIARRLISRKWIDYRSVEHDLNGKVIIVTGGNTGLGYQTAKDLARRKASVLIACRNVEKGKHAVEKIIQETGNTRVACMEIDLSSLKSVHDFVDKVKEHPLYKTIDALICNAGVWVPPDDGHAEGDTPGKFLTKDDFEIHFGVNHLAHFLLAKSLVPNLKASGDGRIVFISSSLLKSGKIDFEAYNQVRTSRQETEEDKKSFAPPAYCDSKLMNSLTSKHLATLLPPEVTTYSVCPGFCRSELGRAVSFGILQTALVGLIMRLVQRTSEQGAQNILFVTLEDKASLESGGCYADGEVAKELTEYMESLGPTAAQMLWDASENLVNEASK